MTKNEHSTASDWATARGAKWRSQLDRTEAMLTPIDGPLIHALRLDAPIRIADVGCGGGGTALEILRRAPQGSVVHGFDISPELIEAARARTPPDERSLSFTRADVATAPPPQVPFERLTSRFGVMFFDDAPSAFRNLGGWLAPGGRFAFAVWGRTADNPWATVVRDVVAAFVEVQPPGPDTPGPFRYGQPDKLLQLLGQAGLGELEVGEWRGEIAIGGGLAAAEAADYALAAFGMAEPVARADEVVRGNARRALTERFSRHLRDGVVRLGACVNLVTGVRTG